MQEKIREQLLSPQFKETEQEAIAQELRKFSSISAIEMNTPDTKYRSTITPSKMDTSKEMNSLHYRNKTCEDDLFRLYDEIKDLYQKREYDQPALVEPKILFTNQEYPSKIIVKRKRMEVQLNNNQVLIDKIYRANLINYNNLYNCI
ncbi:unnamed protein product (macronuclear) [Paramecium tetraurelia]|uniref:Uncharacterized protein n=1 Tax=Paramecium tetraurelia TaxID=5888 RepID=A0E1I4_PARTE|nr:uncharacterized protein GSPATT00022320001 [Paramecium tetraurelia]CAK89151.1 unnamed protein product [Paramecium tetraurelia]|eukprot:XP_001456548.1 hypothetical protein (macronuclear) [Paramecium tetraurelia strain d4-2]